MSFCCGDDLLRESYPFIHGVRHSPLVHGEPDYRRSVLLCDGEQLRKGLILRIDGVEDGFARVGAKSSLHRLGLSAVYLQRRVRERPDEPDQPRQHLALVDAGQPAVDVQNVRTRLHLLERLRGDIVEVGGQKRLLHRLLARGIYAFTHHSDAVNKNGFCGRTDG